MVGNTATIIIKRTPGLSEVFNPGKLQASLVAACLAANTPVGSAELTAARICRDITPWITGKPEVTSLDIRQRALERLQLHNPAAARKYHPVWRLFEIRKALWPSPATITT